MAVTRSVRGFIWGGSPRRDQPRVVIGAHKVVVTEPTYNALVVEPDAGFDVRYATDLYRRIFVIENQNAKLFRSVQFDSYLYGITDPGGGKVPDDDDTFTEITDSRIKGSGNKVFHERQDESWFIGTYDFVGLYTWVYQSPEFWQGPFTVVHELWGNAYRWGRADRKGADDTHPLAELKQTSQDVNLTQKFEGRV